MDPRDSTGKSTRLNEKRPEKKAVGMARGKDVNDHHHQEPEATQLESVTATSYLLKKDGKVTPDGDFNQRSWYWLNLVEAH